MSGDYNMQAPPEMIHLGEEGARTLWVGDVEPHVDESVLYNAFSSSTGLTSVKIIRDKASGYSQGYGFLDFSSHAAAKNVLETLNNTTLPGTSKPIRLNWASYGANTGASVLGGSSLQVGPEFSIFVGDVAPEVTDHTLLSLFQARYSSVKSAKVITDPGTGLNKGYAFVRFFDEDEAQRAITEMQGAYLGSRPMRLSTATPRRNSQQVPQPATSVSPSPYTPPPTQPPLITGQGDLNDPSNATLFLGGVGPDVTEEMIQGAFMNFGVLAHIKIPPGKGCAFVQFTDRSAAEAAMLRMHGAPLGSTRIRIAWGRSASLGPARPLASSPPVPPYSYGGASAQAYGGYGAGMYAGGYPADGGPYPSVPQRSAVENSQDDTFTKPPNVNELNDAHANIRLAELIQGEKWYDRDSLLSDP